MNIYTQMLNFVENTRQEQLKKESITVGELMRMFRQVETKEIKLEDLEITDNMAIVLLGPSVYGKTTFAMGVLTLIDDLEYCSIDDCARELTALGVMNEENDRLSVKMFGERLHALKEKNVPIIVDGLWLNIYTRAALLKTLRKLDYGKICVIDFVTNYDFRIHQNFMVQRAIDLCAWKLLIEAKNIKSATDANLLFDDAKYLLAKRYGITTDQLVETLARSAECEEILRGVYRDVRQELSESFIDIQKQYNLFKAGVDVFISM